MGVRRHGAPLAPRGARPLRLSARGPARGRRRCAAHRDDGARARVHGEPAARGATSPQTRPHVSSPVPPLRRRLARHPDPPDRLPRQRRDPRAHVLRTVRGGRILQPCPQRVSDGGDDDPADHARVPAASWVSSATPGRPQSWRGGAPGSCVCSPPTGVLGVFATWFLGAAYVPLLFGAAYAPIAANLLPLSAAALAFALASVPSLLALVHERPVGDGGGRRAPARRVLGDRSVAHRPRGQPGRLPRRAGGSECPRALSRSGAPAVSCRDQFRDWALPAILGSVFRPWRCSVPADPWTSRSGAPVPRSIAPPSCSFESSPSARSPRWLACSAGARSGAGAGSDLMISRLPEASRGLRSPARRSRSFPARGIPRRLA